MTIKFAAIGLNHSHIYGQVELPVARGGGAGCVLLAARMTSPPPLREKYPQAKRVADRRAILEDKSIALVLTSAILSDRAEIAIAAMQHGKDVMSDKPGMTTLAQLAEIKRVQAETGRIYSVCYSEHFETRSTVKAGELVAAGAIGEVIHTVGLGPHMHPQQPAAGLVLSTASAMAASSAISAATSASSSCSFPTRSTPKCCRPR